MTMIRDAAVAGMFYPGQAKTLSTTIQTLLEEARVEGGPAPKALIVPHAGYSYAGPVAAAAYARLRPHHQLYTRVVLLGPCHRVAIRGMALSAADLFRTPLGDVQVDKEAIESLDMPAVKVIDTAHQFEHSLEVHLPFLQYVIGPFLLVPIAVGDAAPDDVARVLDTLWGGPETLIVISSDLSHYLPYDEALAIDKDTCRAIENLQAGKIDHAHACGATPIDALLISAKRRGLNVVTLDLRNSGDSTAEKSHVVGYGAWMFFGENGSEET